MKPGARGRREPSVDRARASEAPEVEREIDQFLSRFDPAIEGLARKVRRWLRRRLPAAVEMVYDNYNALVFGFAPSERPSDALFSVVVYPRCVSLFFLQGAGLPDPEGLLIGSGTLVRHIRVDGMADLNRRGIDTLIAAALHDAIVPMPRSGRGSVIVRSVSARQRPRRPVAPTNPSSR